MNVFRSLMQKMTPCEYTTLIFDLDDTILQCSKYYEKVRHDFVDYQVTRTKLPRAVIEKLLGGIDVACTGLPDGFSRHRLPRSFSAASAALDIIRNLDVDERASLDSFMLGDAVFSAAYTPYDGAIELLRLYKQAGYHLVCCTKGDYSVQDKKLSDHGLWDIFENVYIVPKKLPETMLTIINDLDLEPSTTVMIGDSIKDDIGMATSNYMDSVWLNHSHIKKWAYEDTENKPTHTIDKLSDLVSIIPLNKQVRPIHSVIPQ
jgi:FMN phosphatase YigB (HAD superfamily)